MGHQKISLRNLRKKDAIRMLEWMNDTGVVEQMRIGENKHTMEEILEFIQKAQQPGKDMHYAIVDQDDTYLGTVSLKQVDKAAGSAEFAIALHLSAIGRGVAELATLQVLKIAFSEIQLQEVYLNVLSSNIRAIRFYEKLGWEYLRCTQIKSLGEDRSLKWYVFSKQHFYNEIISLEEEMPWIRKGEK